MDARRRVSLLNYYYYYHYRRLEIKILLLLGKVKERHAVSVRIAGSTAAVIRFSAYYFMFIFSAHTFFTYK